MTLYMKASQYISLPWKSLSWRAMSSDAWPNLYLSGPKCHWKLWYWAGLTFPVNLLSVILLLRFLNDSETFEAHTFLRGHVLNVAHTKMDVLIFFFFFSSKGHMQHRDCLIWHCVLRLSRISSEVLTLKCHCTSQNISESQLRLSHFRGWVLYRRSSTLQSTQSTLNCDPKL